MGDGVWGSGFTFSVMPLFGVRPFVIPFLGRGLLFGDFYVSALCFGMDIFFWLSFLGNGLGFEGYTTGCFGFIAGFPYDL